MAPTSTSSRRRTELVWDGKYDEYGRRRDVDIAACAMPMQKIETIDQPRSEAAADGQLEMFEKHRKHRDDFRNRLIWGDNKLVLASLLAEFKGRVDLIYIDPPFDVGADFTMDVPIGDGNETVGKDQSTLEMVAYRDMWGKGTDSYLHMMFERLTLMKELLAENGSIYVHCDWRMNSSLRILMDEVFGRDRFQNDLVWKRQSPSSSKARSRKFSADHDTILFYSKSKIATFKPVYGEYPEEEIEKRFRQSDERGRYKDAELATYSNETLERLKKENRLIVTSGGKFRYKIYLDEIEGVLVDSIWSDIPPVNSQADQDTSYSTQKPEALLERIIETSSKDGDLNTAS